MIKNILVTDTGMYVNHRLSSLANFKENVCVIKMEPATNDMRANMKVLDLSADKAYLDLSKTGYDSWQYSSDSTTSIRKNRTWNVAT